MTQEVAPPVVLKTQRRSGEDKESTVLINWFLMDKKKKMRQMCVISL